MAWRLLRLEPLGLQEGRASPPEPGAFRPLEEPWEAKRGGRAPWAEPLYFAAGVERGEALVAKGPRLARRVGVGLEEALWAGELVYEPAPTLGEGLEGLQAGLRAAREALEKEVAEGLEGGLLVVDGPVRLLREGPLLGYIKTHWVRYLPKEREALLEALAPGERTPAFRVHRKGLELASWYVRLPLPPEGLRPPLAGLLRVETPLAGPFLELADLSLGLFPALASHPVKDPRAPQNLLPVGGLERELSRRMGRPEVVGRMLARYLGGAR